MIGFTVAIAVTIIYLIAEATARDMEAISTNRCPNPDRD